MERYNQAGLELAQVRDELHQTKHDLKEARQELRANQNRLNRRVSGIYKAGQDFGYIELILSTRTLADFFRTINSVQTVSAQDAKFVGAVKEQRREIRAAAEQIAAAEKRQSAVEASLAETKGEIEADLQEQETQLDQVNGNIAEAEAEAAARVRVAAAARLDRQARASAAALAMEAPAAPAAPIPTVPASGKGGEIARLALAELGKPYVWAAAGPNSFDCSGLTMYVFAKVGISLPHSAEAQYGMGTSVSRDSLQPGDLVFGAYGGYISHVGIYIGGDQYVTAPQTGDVVKISILSRRRNYVGARRYF